MTETTRRLNIKLKILPTPEQATATYSEIARGALDGSPDFERMNEAAQAMAIGDTAYLIASTLFKYGGHLAEKGSDAAWSSFNHKFSRRTAKDSIVVRFRKTLGDSAEGVYTTAFNMLLTGARTREALAALRKPPVDILEGMRDSLRRTTDDNLVEIMRRAPKKVRK
ncbi:MAG TPA: hypothetical protein VMR77_00385 [Patescibacteria group bacterium]|jgi:hypothetical protein|nr:hypothetical protein [Patescibacteria group bacterium]